MVYFQYLIMLAIFPPCIRIKIQNCIYVVVLKPIFGNFFFAIIKRRSSFSHLSWELRGIITLTDQIESSEDSEPFYLFVCLFVFFLQYFPTLFTDTNYVPC